MTDETEQLERLRLALSTINRMFDLSSVVHKLNQTNRPADVREYLVAVGEVLTFLDGAEQ